MHNSRSDNCVVVNIEKGLKSFDTAIDGQVHVSRVSCLIANERPGLILLHFSIHECDQNSDEAALV